MSRLGTIGALMLLATANCFSHPISVVARRTITHSTPTLSVAPLGDMCGPSRSAVVLKANDGGNESTGLREPWRSMMQVIYYGAYVSFFGKMVLVLLERGLPGNMPGASS